MAASALDFPCPTCRAAIRKVCTRPSGHPTFGGECHASRLRLAGLRPAARRSTGGRIPDNVLVLPFEQSAPEEPPWEGPVPPLRVPGDPHILAGTLDAFGDLPDPVYSTGSGSLYCGDSLALMGKLEPGSVRLCFTSPPYALVRKKAYGNPDAAAFSAWLMPFVHRIRRLLHPDGLFALNLGPAWTPGQPTQSLYDVQTLLDVADRLHCVYDGIWYKPGTLPGPAQWVTIERIRLTQATERLWVFSKNPDALDLLPEGVYLDRFLAIPNKDSNSAYHRRCRRHGVRQHPARFPPALPRYFIERLTQPGELVLDPFGGSNTTGWVAESLDRRWQTIELDARYCRDSWLRFGEEPLQAARGARRAA